MRTEKNGLKNSSEHHTYSSKHSLTVINNSLQICQQLDLTVRHQTFHTVSH